MDTDHKHATDRYLDELTSPDGKNPHLADNRKAVAQISKGRHVPVYAADSLLLITTRAVNGIYNRSGIGTRTREADPEFYPPSGCLAAPAAFWRGQYPGTPTTARDRAPRASSGKQAGIELPCAHMLPREAGEEHREAHLSLDMLPYYELQWCLNRRSIDAAAREQAYDHPRTV